MKVPETLLVLGQLDVLKSLELLLDVFLGSRFRGLAIFQGRDLSLRGATPAPGDPLVKSEDENRGQDSPGRHQEILVSHEEPRGEEGQ